eukprot:1158753-Pelagomonas_calceolata.AAC.5
MLVEFLFWLRPSQHVDARTDDLAAKVQCPVALLPAKGDPMESLKEVRACVPVFEGGWMGVRFLAG